MNTSQNDVPLSSSPNPEQPAAQPGDKADTREIFDSSLTFEQLGLRGSVLKGITEAGFKHPTTIQAKLIPAMLTGRDVLGQAKTGTGKTAAFGLPLLHLSHKDVPMQGLVLAPTRELAVQITDEINALGKHTPIRAVSVYGGQAIQAQARNLQRASQIIVATPGRLMDMHERGFVNFKNVRIAVLDEVDRMLDIGFRDDIVRILSMCPPPPATPEQRGAPGTRQTVVVSATISKDVENLARKHMRDAEKITTSAGSLTASLVTQHYLSVLPHDKRRLLVHLLQHEEPALTIVFCRLKRVVDELARMLTAKGIEAHAMHGDMSQSKRNSTMKRLREGGLSVLIASDLASRGIDVDGITHVINYDLPEDPDLYVHRIGRTARAGRGGVAWSLVTPEQGELLTQIEQLINAEIPKMDYGDFVPSAEEGYHGRGGGRGGGGRGPQRSGPPRGGGGGGDAPNQPQEPAQPPQSNRIVEAANKPLPAAPDPVKFPGGIVPTKLPPKRMHGRLPSGRGR